MKRAASGIVVNFGGFTDFRNKTEQDVRSRVYPVTTLCGQMFRD